ncbi:hypothetical protein L195_g050897, partial [Trifolium pratense]
AESLVAIRKLWKNDLPSKVGVFGWRLLLEKLPTRVALAHRGDRPYSLYAIWSCSERSKGNEISSFNLVGNYVVFLANEK